MVTWFPMISGVPAKSINSHFHFIIHGAMNASLVTQTLEGQAMGKATGFRSGGGQIITHYTRNGSGGELESIAPGHAGAVCC